MDKVGVGSERGSATRSNVAWNSSFRTDSHTFFTDYKAVARRARPGGARDLRRTDSRRGLRASPAGCKERPLG